MIYINQSSFNENLILVRNIFLTKNQNRKVVKQRVSRPTKNGVTKILILDDVL